VSASAQDSFAPTRPGRGGSKAGVRKQVSEEQVRAVLRGIGAKESIAAIARAVGLSRPTIYAILRAESQPVR